MFKSIHLPISKICIAKKTVTEHDENVMWKAEVEKKGNMDERKDDHNYFHLFNRNELCVSVEP